jgi:hypothetical protein
VTVAFKGRSDIPHGCVALRLGMLHGCKMK